MRHLVPLLLALVASGAIAADQGAGSAAGQMPDMAMMQPGAEHQQLAKLAGSWNVACTMWMEPGKPPMESKGTAKMEMVLDGRYLRQDFTGDFMGQPFTGLGFEGYDRVKKAYTSSWMDSMSTSSMHMDGTSSDNGKTITYAGQCSCPMQRGQIPMRSVTTISDDNAFTVTMFATRDGKEAKSMELRYTRAK